jgi:hypothetical protein
MLKDVIKVSLLQKGRTIGAANTSFLVINPDFHFVLAMDVIVFTAGVRNVLWTSVCTRPPVLEAEVL